MGFQIRTLCERLGTPREIQTVKAIYMYVGEFRHKAFMVDPETGNVLAVKNLEYEQPCSYVVTFARIDLTHPDSLRYEAAIYVGRVATCQL